MQEDPVDNVLHGLGDRLGVQVERREASPVETMVGSGLGGLGGQLVGKVLRLGWLGSGLCGLAGGVAGLLAVSYRVRWRPDTEPEAAPDLEPH